MWLLVLSVLGLHGRAAQLELLRAIGSAIATLHDGGIVHGDLTTSNLLVRAADNALVRITLIFY